MARLRFLFFVEEPEDEERRALSPAHASRTGSGPWTADFEMSDEARAFAAIPSLERVLPMSLRLMLRVVGRNEFRSDIALLIP
jgi:hypothetical protein